jgi:hypothetical protein
MKQNRQLNHLVKFNAVAIFAISLIAILGVQTRAENTNFAYKAKPESVIASVHLDWLHFSDSCPIVVDFTSERKQLIKELLNVFNDPKTSNFNQCTCAYYLGEMRASEAADALATAIALEFSYSHVVVRGIPDAAYDPAYNALVKIGRTAIPAVIRNLAESDDSKVRTLSLKVLYRIEEDKDIAQLRLQKALNVQKASQKQTRLQAAIKSLAAMSFDK